MWSVKQTHPDYENWELDESENYTIGSEVINGAYLGALRSCCPILYVHYSFKFYKQGLEDSAEISLSNFLDSVTQIESSSYTHADIFIELAVNQEACGITLSEDYAPRIEKPFKEVWNNWKLPFQLLLR